MVTTKVGSWYGRERECWESRVLEFKADIHYLEGAALRGGELPEAWVLVSKTKDGKNSTQIVSLSL